MVGFFERSPQEAAQRGDLLDPTPDLDAARALELLRERRARLRDAVATRSSLDACVALHPADPAHSSHSSEGDEAMAEVLEAAAWAEQKLAAALERVALYRTTIAQLAAAARELAAIDGQDEVLAALPALALLVTPRSAVALLKVRPDGSVQVLSRCGAPLEEPQARIDEEARRLVLTAAPRRKSGATHGTQGAAPGLRRAGRAVLVPIARGADGWVLVVERAAADASEGEDVEHLALFGALVGSALESARAAAASRATTERDAAVLAAIRDGVLVVDREGVVRGANPAAFGALGARREDLLGRRLRDVPGLAALAATVARGAGDVEVVTLPHGDVGVRAQPYEHGVVATLRDLPAEHAGARRATVSSAHYTFDDFVGTAPAFLRVVGDARRAARSDAPVLICGESGTGKELLAQAIHNASARSSAPFIGINVTAIPRDLLESELFGYEGGAFTGAKAGGHAGKFELAGRGTLLLDEIGDMPVEMQAKLLRVLQEKVVQRVGSARDIPVRARIIATSHRDLPEAVSTGRFRLDLFHRLCVIHLHLPPLRERRGDVALIIEHQLERHAERTGRHVRIAPRALGLLDAYDWPGNIRELVNLVEGELGILPPGEDAFTRLPQALVQARAPSGADAAPEVVSLAELERRACEETLARFRGNVARAAHALGVAKGTLYAKIKRYSLEPGRPSEPAQHGAPHSNGESHRDR